MIHSAMHALRRPLAVAALSVGLSTLTGLAHPAVARVWVGFGFPLVVGPPAYYPPPVYYPPPAYYAPPAYYPPAYYPPPYYPPPAYSPPVQYRPSGQSCVAGPAVCPMQHPVASGAGCYCTTTQGRLWGRAT
jgi:S-formylglutathione hydrolase FrmB